MTEAEKEELQEYRRQELLRHMTDISEDHWASRWHEGLEHDLYLMTFHGLPADYGMGVIEPARLARMERLAQLCQSWWGYSDAQRQPAPISLEEAERRYAKLLARDEAGAEHTLSIPEAKELYASAVPSDWAAETVSSPLKGMPGWQLYRLRTSPMLVLVRRLDADEGDGWELRFGGTTVDRVYPTWARHR